MQEGVNEGLLIIDDVVADVCIAALGTDLIAERRTCTESLVIQAVRFSAQPERR